MLWPQRPGESCIPEPRDASTPNPTRLLCLCLPAIVSSTSPSPSVFLHHRRQQIVALLQTQHSQIARLVGRLTLRVALCWQPNSARAAHGLPLVGLIWGSHRWLGPLLYLDGPSYVFLTPFTVDVFTPFQIASLSPSMLPPSSPIHPSPLRSMSSIWRPFAYFSSFSDTDVHRYNAVRPVAGSTIPGSVSFLPSFWLTFVS